MKVVSVGWMGAKIEFPHCTFRAVENGSLVISNHDGTDRALFPAGSWNGAIYEEREDVTPQTLEEQLKEERLRTDDIAFAASEGRAS